MLPVRILKKCIVLGLMPLFLCSSVLAQVVDKDVYKTYILKDTLSIYKTGAILLFTDSTFLNVGVVHDKEKLDVYLWYQTGNWKGSAQNIVFVANEKAMREDEMKKLIKQFYRKHRDHHLINTYYEYVHEKYRIGRMTISGETILDNDRQINYITIKP